MKNSRFIFSSLRHQQGVSTLIFSILILALTVIATLTTFSFVRQEQVLSNNDGRAKQAFEAAEAGLATALTYFGDGPDRDDDDVIDPVFDTDNDGIGDSSTATVGRGSVNVAAVQTGNQIAVTATGFSDDRSATHVISQLLGVVDPLPNDPSNPMISKGTVVINGSATVHNQEGHSTIWSGADVDLGSNNSTATEVPDMGDTGYPLCMDTPMTCSTVSSSNKVTVGLDVIENDSSLGNLTPTEMFQNFFGMTPDAYRSSGLVTLETTPAEVNSDVQLAGHEVIWVEGDASFVNNTSVGCTVKVTGNKTCTPADSEPSILIVNGNADFDGTPNFTGLVFVTGNVNITGNMTVMGAIVIAGDLSSNAGGSMDVWYNSDVLADLENAGVRVGMAGTWKDF
ncbi:hypothetical protein SAMN04487965_3401 [Microbulbifer donghaiensis]|uniref:PilX N-terminal n=1 Tax=Microbulbifer donghaiensis TaxID=494016 RepID=A0A1M5HEF5_9GAMM|nr:pilus assembly PilX N-terminal domain-containing protein [Microbulbifer donghaiensis]SHG14311.1 hypothetical protein SAMN04487965_3401 [Microbulbifer donghaiensis]